MTVYTGDVDQQIAALADAIGAVPDFDQADMPTITALRMVASTTVDLITSKVMQLDPQLLGDGETVGGIAAGVFPTTSLGLMATLAANLEQMSRLIDCGAYAGRIEINLKQATG